MAVITINLPEEPLRRLEEMAREANVTPEEFLRASVVEWLRRPDEDFRRAAEYVLRKNAELYRRLA